MDFAALYQKGIRFIYHKVTEGLSYKDPLFATNITAAKAAGMLVGAFHYFHPAFNAAAQAAFAKSVAGTLDLPLACDAETTDNQTSTTIVAGVRAFCDACGRAVVYTSAGFWPSPTETVGNVALWDASWGSKGPHLISGWPYPAFWQYAGDVRIPGVSGLVDRDRFNGSLDALKAWAGAPAVHPKYDLSTVKGIQQALIALGYHPGAIDGRWGPATMGSVEAFQKNAGLVVDGIVGTNTRRALSIALA